jgi:hypothetical protein
MTEAVLAALITGGLSLAGVIVSGLLTIKKTEKTLAVSQAVTDTKLEELTREVREHNNFALRVPVMEEKLKSISHRLENLEKK